MTMDLQALWNSGWLLNGVILLTLIELAALVLYRRLSGRGIPARDYALNMLSGLCLMLAVRSVMLNEAWFATAAWLSAAGLVHVIDMVRRWRRHGRRFG